jgi:MaoC dehydratase-like protein
MIASYARAVGDVAVLESDLTEAPPTFCTALRRGMTPEVELPPGLFGVHGGHDIEVFASIRAGHSYRMSARITDVFEKSGRSGRLTVVVREVTVRDATSAVVARIVERQIIRERPAAP